MLQKIRKTEQDTIHLVLNVMVGSCNEDSEETGLSHFVEHMNLCFQKYRIDKSQILYRGIGRTDYYSTNYVIATRKEQAPLVQKFIDGITTGEYICQEYLEDVRKDILKELDEKNKDIENRLVNLMLEGTGFEKRNPVGERKAVCAYTLEDIQKFHKKWYLPENMHLAYLECGENIQFPEAEKDKLHYNKKFMELEVGWAARDASLGTNLQRVRIAHKISITKILNLCDREYTLYEFLVDMASELLEQYLEAAPEVSNVKCESKVLTREEDIWWLDFQCGAGIKNPRRFWNEKRNAFPAWVQKNWSSISTFYNGKVEQYETLVTTDYLLQRYHEYIVYNRKFEPIGTQKIKIQKLLRTGGITKIMAAMSSVFTMDEEIVITY